MQMFRNGFSQWAIRVLVAAVVAGIVSWFWCLFTVHGESGTVFLTVLGGTCGGCVGTFSPGWKVGRLASNVIAGILLSLILYYSVRGVLVRAAASPSTVRACGVAAVSFLASVSKTPGEAWNRIGGRALVLLTLGFVIRGIVLLCR
jgi:hypothetical protein